MPRELHHVPTPAELDRLVTDEEGFAVHEAAPSDNSRPAVRLWDTIEGAYTNPLPYDMVSHKVRQVAYRCIYCPYCSQREGDVLSHGKSVEEQRAAHLEASISEGSHPQHGTYFFCDVCGSKSQMRSKVQRHINTYTQRPAHLVPFAILVRRFILNPAMGT